MRTSSVCVRCSTRSGSFDRSSILGLRRAAPEASTGRQNRDLRRAGDPLVTPLGIVLRKLPRVGLGRNERARTFSSAHKSHCVAWDVCRSGNLAKNILVASASHSPVALPAAARVAAPSPFLEQLTSDIAGSRWKPGDRTVLRQSSRVSLLLLIVTGFCIRESILSETTFTPPTTFIDGNRLEFLLHWRRSS